jgi:hypothetical protein
MVKLCKRRWKDPISQAKAQQKVLDAVTLTYGMLQTSQKKYRNDFVKHLCEKWRVEYYPKSKSLLKHVGEDEGKKRVLEQMSMGEVQIKVLLSIEAKEAKEHRNHRTNDRSISTHSFHPFKERQFSSSSLKSHEPPSPTLPVNGGVNGPSSLKYRERDDSAMSIGSGGRSPRSIIQVVTPGSSPSVSPTKVLYSGGAGPLLGAAHDQLPNLVLLDASQGSASLSKGPADTPELESM